MENETKINELSDKDIKLFMMYGKTIKISHTSDGKIVLCSEGIFDALFKENKYSHESKMRKKMSVDATHREASKDYDFYSLEKFERYFLEYKVQSAAYKNSVLKEDGRYDNYADFISNGGVNILYKKSCEEMGLDSDRIFKNIDSEYLKRIESKIEKDTILDLDEEIEKEETMSIPVEPTKKTGLRGFMTNEDVYLWSTVLLVICLMPFTFLALMKYISIEGSGWKLYLSYFMSGGLSIAFDWSILVFTINGKKKLANIGSVFQVVFISVHFDLISGVLSGTIIDSHVLSQNIQGYVTKIFAVVYAAILINQFSELSKEKNEKN